MRVAARLREQGQDFHTRSADSFPWELSLNSGGVSPSGAVSCWLIYLSSVDTVPRLLASARGWAASPRAAGVGQFGGQRDRVPRGAFLVEPSRCWGGDSRPGAYLSRERGWGGFLAVHPSRARAAFPRRVASAPRFLPTRATASACGSLSSGLGSA